MPPFVLTVLKLFFLALLYFFVYRAVRAVVKDLYGPPRAKADRGARRAAPAPGGKRRLPTQVVLVNEKGGRLGSYKLNGAVQIGRADTCQVKIEDTYASQFHARLFDREGQWFVEDLGSTNGTYLNQRKVTAPAEVGAGDQIRIGRTLLELKR